MVAYSICLVNPLLSSVRLVTFAQAVIDGAASSKHVPLESVTHWIFAGHSMVLNALSC